MAEGGLLRTWWLRLRGRLEPRPFPFADAALLESPLRGAFASPKRILGAFGLGHGETVLEIGPGIGYYSREAVARVGESGRLVCLDVQREMLRATRSRLGRSGQAQMVQASALALPFATGSFDRVFLITVLGEIPERSRALEEIRRVLRAGGRLSVSEQLPDPDFVTLSALRSELRGAGFAEQSSERHFAIAYSSTWSRGPE
jgi:ubiquinone/menaquinone biosynthesis C-methylase UbiE